MRRYASPVCAVVVLWKANRNLFDSQRTSTTVGVVCGLDGGVAQFSGTVCMTA